MRADRSLAVLLLLASASARADEPGGIPAGFEHVSATDLTFTLRDDHFGSITADPGDTKTIYVGTGEGRVYRSTDGGATWIESTVIPERKRLWATPGGNLFFGAVRDAGAGASEVDLIGRDPMLSLGRMPSSLPRLPAGGAPTDHLLSESLASAGGDGGLFGVGLSNRAPRLSQLVGSRGIPVAVLNRGQFIATRSVGGTTVLDVTVDPEDPRLLFAATDNGLYRSTDRGDSWVRTFAGLAAAERTATRIAIRPVSPSLFILGTSSGAYVSLDRGDNWSKLTTAYGTINDVAYDLKDTHYVYLASSAGVLRSTDGAQSFVPMFQSSLPAESNVLTISIDPTDPDTGYIGTMHGMFVTHQLRSGNSASWTGLEGVQGSLSVRRVFVCPRHHGHLVALTRLELDTINYGADAPESAIIESWDGGHTWRSLFSGQAEGHVNAFAPDLADPDALWVAATGSLYRLERAAPGRRASREDRDDLEAPGPPLGEVVLAALRYHGLELDEFSELFHKPKLGSILPRRFGITGRYRRWSFGGVVDDPQFAQSRYLQVADANEWQVMAWASWDLPDLVYSADTVPMLRRRVNVITDEVRHQVLETVKRDYGELQRLLALGPARNDLEARVLYRLRVEQLTSVVDLASGGYLTRWRKHHRRAT